MPPSKRETHKPPFRLPRRRSSKRSILWAVAVSVGLHLPLLVGLPQLFENTDALSTTEFNSAQEFSLSMVEEAERDEEDEEKRSEERDGQFVSLPAPQKEERPDEARFLDQYDSKTDEEMARREPGEQAAPAAPPSRSEPSHRPEQRQEPRPPQPQSEQPQPEQEQEQESRASAEEAEPAEESEPSVDLEEARAADESLVDEPKESRSDEASKQASKQDSKPDPRALFPSMESAQAALGGGSVDYLRDVEEGDKTLLNRKQSRYWSFMNRLKEQVVQEWSPGEEYRRRDPRGKVYGVKDRFTNLRITLNGDGSLRSIYIAQTSGLDFYDEEAVRAVKAAGPFPNPPEGMKDQDGLIHINFGFMLDIHTGSMRNIRIRRR